MNDDEGRRRELEAAYATIAAQAARIRELEQASGDTNLRELAQLADIASLTAGDV